MSESLTDTQLGAIVDALDSFAVRQIQGFHYAPNYLIRDCMRKPGTQVIWSGPDSIEDAVFARQCEIERLRVAMAIAQAQSQSTALAEARAEGRRQGLEEALSEAELKAAEEAVTAEWKAMAKQLRAGHISWPVSPTNWRILRAGWQAIAKHRATAPAETQKPEASHHANLTDGAS